MALNKNKTTTGSTGNSRYGPVPDALEPDSYNDRDVENETPSREHTNTPRRLTTKPVMRARKGDD